MLFSFSTAKTKKLKSCHGCCKMRKGSYFERMTVHSNVKDGQIVFHKMPVNGERQKAWIHAVTKGREIFFEKPNHFNLLMPGGNKKVTHTLAFSCRFV